MFQVLRYAEALKKTITDDSARDAALDAVSKVNSDSSLAKAISRDYEEAFDEPELWSVAESAHDSVADFCSEHGVKPIVVGSSWWGETAPSSTAAKTAASTKKKRRLKGLLPEDKSDDQAACPRQTRHSSPI